MVERKVKKFPLVDADGTLLGLITARDLVRRRRMPFATRDLQGRLGSARRSARPVITSSAPPS